MFLSKNKITVGRNPVFELLQNDTLTIDKILIAKQVYNSQPIQDIIKLAKTKNIPFQTVPIEKINSLTNTIHQGVIAFRSIIKYYDLQEIIDWVNNKGEVPLFIILEGITDVRNIGAIIRTAFCCGAQALIIPEKGIAPLQEEASKASAGTLEKIHICRSQSLIDTVQLLKLNGIQTVCSLVSTNRTFFDIDLKLPSAIIMGSEDKGVSHALSNMTDVQATIPLQQQFDSLNVSVATGMILYEVLRQRKIIKE
ncbi:MAG: 23S rRNA (guanosine(2251)-2'-O)-methyltransferase RlmB [Phycisphaerales bacterium]|nr:23S rRNA (guanosine(2251)-2'-O)-methyltransferase RlmB [Phycisphaerales bacterium]